MIIITTAIILPTLICITIPGILSVTGMYCTIHTVIAIQWSCIIRKPLFTTNPEPSTCTFLIIRCFRIIQKDSLPVFPVLILHLPATTITTRTVDRMPEIFLGKYLAPRVAAQVIQKAPVHLHPATPLHRAVPLLGAAGVMLRGE